MPDLEIQFDGLCEPRNPGGVLAWGFTISADGRLIHEGHGSAAAGPLNTNNVAEYLALGFALRWATDHGGFDGLRIRGDSQLVVKQVNGEWQCKAGHLRRYRDRCRELLNGTGKPWRVEWVPREQNEAADQLSRRGYVERTGKQPSERRKASA